MVSLLKAAKGAKLKLQDSPISPASMKILCLKKVGRHKGAKLLSRGSYSPNQVLLEKKKLIEALLQHLLSTI
jgi:hypothetical protein